MIRVNKSPDNLAHLIESFNWDDLLMCSNLKHTISRCVYDWLASLYVFLAEFFYNLCARCSLISKVIKACLFFKTLHDFFWKSVRKCWQRLVKNKSCHLPVASFCIFTFRCLQHPSKRGGCTFYFFESLNPFNKTDAHSLKIWQV